MSQRILNLQIRAEFDVLASRQRARQIAILCGFGTQDQARIATAVSELARNVFNYTDGGKIHFSIEGETTPQLLLICIDDEGPGIANLELVLAGRYRSPTGMGMGLLGAKRLMDQCDIQTGPKGTHIKLRKFLPGGHALLTPATIGAMGGQLAALSSDVSLSEMQQQNKELLATLAELKARQDELLQLTKELEDTNRGVVALYAELDEKADHLRRADEMKSRFLSNMSHEFRTPLSSIRALARLLIDRIDGELNTEQDKQARYILASAESLTELVDDLLDMAKIEAGKIEVRPLEFDVGVLFSTLRGMLRPLLVGSSVDLVFEDPSPPLRMVSDEGKVSQILRNYISNALKFTEQGEVRIRARECDGGAAVLFSVSDTGLGISIDDQQFVFEEFNQVANRLQSRVKGTGLGLPLCRKLAALLGGSVGLSSALGAGSTFTASLPRTYLDLQAASPPQAGEQALPQDGQHGALDVLVVEDNPGILALYQSYLRNTRFRMVPARSIWEAEQALGKAIPSAVLLDLYLTGENTWRWMADFKNDARRQAVPIIVASETNDPSKAFALGAEAYFTKPLLREELLARLDALI
jgi:signal transduction histidine kinase